MVVIREEENCRQYVKGCYPNFRYFISEKTEKFKRLKISGSFSNDLQELAATDFKLKVRAAMVTAKDTGSENYYEATV